MVNECDFLPFATGVGANVLDQADFEAASWLSSGFLAGLAQSIQLNKVWRQSSFVAAALAQLTSTTLAQDVLDNGNLPAFIAQLQAALSILASSRPARIVTVSTALALVLTDYRVALNRTVGPAATAVTLPNPGVNYGQSFRIGDIAGNFSTYPVTVTPPAGHTIAGAANFTLNEDLQWAEFAYFQGNIWSVET